MRVPHGSARFTRSTVRSCHYYVKPGTLLNVDAALLSRRRPIEETDEKDRIGNSPCGLGKTTSTLS